MKKEYQEKRIPIIKIHDFLIVSIQVDMHDKLGLEMPGVDTALTMEKGMEMLEHRLENSE